MSQAANSSKICNKCFAEVPISVPFCTDCGAPMTDEPGAEGSDAAVYPELSRANLLRVRGDYDQARNVCLAILRRFPNNATAHTLLGDICSEEGDLPHAAEWYEMALDLEPENIADQNKLESVKQRMADHEAASTAQQLGIPTTKPKAKVFAAVVICFVILIGVGAFFLGDYFRAKHGPAGTVTTPVELGGEDPGTTQQTDAVPNATGTTPSPVDGDKPVQSPPIVNEPTSVVTDDQKDLENVRAKCARGDSILEAKFDPRIKPPTVLLTFKIAGAEDVKAAVAELAASALDQLEISRATVRAVRDGRVVFIADMEKGDLAAVAPDATTGKRAPDALIALLKNQWENPTAAAAPTR